MFGTASPFSYRKWQETTTGQVSSSGGCPLVYPLHGHLESTTNLVADTSSFEDRFCEINKIPCAVREYPFRNLRIARYPNQNQHKLGGLMGSSVPSITHQQNFGNLVATFHQTQIHVGILICSANYKIKCFVRFGTRKIFNLKNSFSIL